MKKSQELEKLFDEFKNLLENKKLNNQQKTDQLIEILKKTDIELRK